MVDKPTENNTLIRALFAKRCIHVYHVDSKRNPPNVCVTNTTPMDNARGWRRHYSTHSNDLFQIELKWRQQRSRACSKSEMYGVSGGDVQQPINHAQWFNGNKTQKLRSGSCLICGPTSQHAGRLEGKLIQRSFAACSVANFNLLQMQHVRFLAKWFDRNEATLVSSSPRRPNRISSRA